MRTAILFTVLALVALSLAEDTEQDKNKDNPSLDKDANENKDKADTEKYTDRFDNINVDEIIANRRLLVPYLKCVLDKGRCTPEGKELKVHIKDAMQSACKKCTDKQKEGARKVVNHIKDNEPVYWEELTTKYDPTGEYKPIYEAFLAGKESL